MLHFQPPVLLSALYFTFSFLCCFQLSAFLSALRFHPTSCIIKFSVLFSAFIITFSFLSLKSFFSLWSTQVCTINELVRANSAINYRCNSALFNLRVSKTGKTGKSRNMVVGMQLARLLCIWYALNIVHWILFSVLLSVSGHRDALTERFALTSIFFFFPTWNHI